MSRGPDFPFLFEIAHSFIAGCFFLVFWGIGVDGPGIIEL